MRANHPRVLADRPGQEDLWAWFQLSYASFLVLPRVLMHEMPDKWQATMAVLLREYDQAYPFLREDGYGTTVRLTRKGKLVKTPPWLIDYRHPDRAAIKRYTR